MSDDLTERIEAFLNYLLRVRGYSERTVTTYATALHQMRRRCEWYEEAGDRVLDIMPWRLEIRALSRRTIHAKLTAVRSFVRYLSEQENLRVRAIGIETIKTPQTLPRPVEEHIIAEVLEAAPPLEHLMIVLLYGLGLRISELAHLRLDQIDAEWVTIHGKGGKTRQLPLLPALQREIALYRQRYAPRHYLLEKEGKPIGAATLRYRLTRLFRAHGFHATPHQLRHAFATHLLGHGARIADVSELLGHASMATTQIYTQLGSVKKMEEYMGAHPLAKNGN